MTCETWKGVPGFEGLYEVSNLGRVRSLDRVVRYRSGPVHTHRGRVLKLAAGRSGYPHVQLFRNGHGVCRSVHSLVLAAFVGPRPKGHQCRHKNGHRKDARLSNLEYGTARENCLDKRRHNTHMPGSRNPASVLSEPDVALIYKRLQDGETQTALAAEYGVTSTAIGHIARGTNWASLTGGEIPNRMRGNRRLTDSALREIADRLRRGDTAPSIAKDFGVEMQSIYAIKQGRRWSHITGIKPKRQSA